MHNKLKPTHKPLFLFLVICIFNLIGASLGLAQSGATIDLASLTLSPGETGTVVAHVHCDSQCSLFSVTFGFDPSVIEVESVEVGTYLGETMVVEKAIDNDGGTVHLTAVALGTPPPPESDNLFTLQVRAVAFGTSQFNTLEAQLGDLASNSLNTAVTGGLVVVQSQANATPTPPVEGPTVAVSPDERVVIGVASGLSGEGIAPLGVDIQRGAELALQDRPTVTVDGRTFNVTLNVQDDQCSADGGQAVAHYFSSDSSIVGVVGPMCSSACRAAAPIFDAADYTSISPSCTAPDLTTSDHRSFNRTVVSDSFQGAIAAEYMYKVLGVRSIATIHDGSTYGEGLVTVVSDRFKALGGKVVSSDAVSVGDTDFRGLLDDIAQTDPELIYFGGFPAEAARLIEQRADAGLESVPFMGADGIQGTEVVNLSGAASEGVYATAAIPAGSPALTDFVSRYVTTYGEQPPAPYHANSYDGVNVLLDAIEAIGYVDANGDLVISRNAISAYVRSLNDFQGLTGVLNADGTGDTSVADIGIFRVENGAFVQVYTGSVVTGNVILEPFEIAFARQSADSSDAAIYLAQADGSNVRRLTGTDTLAILPAWSPDGSQIAYTGISDPQFDDAAIYVMQADGSNVRRLTPSGMLTMGCAWSPDGTKIAFTVAKLATNEAAVYVIQVNGAQIRRLTDAATLSAFPTWSPDGSQIAFMGGADRTSIYVMQADGSNVRPLTNSDLSPGFLAWSPDGALIAFEGSSANGTAIYVMQADGSNIRQLTHDLDVVTFAPTWSPDGMQITFAVSIGDNLDIYTMDRDGSNPRPLLSFPENDSMPAWRP